MKNIRPQKWIQLVHPGKQGTPNRTPTEQERVAASARHTASFEHLQTGQAKVPFEAHEQAGKSGKGKGKYKIKYINLLKNKRADLPTPEGGLEEGLPIGHCVKRQANAGKNATYHGTFFLTSKNAFSIVPWYNGRGASFLDTGVASIGPFSHIPFHFQKSHAKQSLKQEKLK